MIKKITKGIIKGLLSLTILAIYLTIFRFPLYTLGIEYNISSDTILLVLIILSLLVYSITIDKIIHYVRRHWK